MKSILILCVAFVVIAAIVLAALRLARLTRLWPAALLIVTAPLEVYRSSSGAGLNVSIFRLALVVSVAALALDMLRGRKSLTHAVPLPFLIYGALVLWQLISLVFVTANDSLAYRFLGQYAGGLVAALVITCYVERRDLRVVAALCGGATILPLAAAAFRVFSVSSGGTGDLPGLTELPVNLTIEAARQSGSSLLNGTQRLTGTFSDPNQFGFYVSTTFLVLAGTACSVLFVDRSISRKAATSYALLAVATAIAIVGTYSRSAWVLAVVGVGVFGVLLGRSFWTRRRVIGVGLVGVLALGLASPFIASRLGSSEPGNVKSTQVHEHTMQIALKLVVHHPFVGVGLGGYGHYADQPALISSSVSTFLTVAAELGIPGLLLLVTAIVMTVVGGVRSLSGSSATERVVLAGFVAAFGALAAANTIGEVWMNDFQWVLFGSLLALTSQSQATLRPAWLLRRHSAAGDDAPKSTKQAPVAA